MQCLSPSVRLGLCMSFLFPIVAHLQGARQVLACFGCAHSTHLVLFRADCCGMPADRKQCIAACTATSAHHCQTHFYAASKSQSGKTITWRLAASRAVICWVRAALQYCHAESPRPCIVYLTSDSSEVRAWSTVGGRAFVA